MFVSRDPSVSFISFLYLLTPAPHKPLFILTLHRWSLRNSWIQLCFLMNSNIQSKFISVVIFITSLLFSEWRQFVKIKGVTVIITIYIPSIGETRILSRLVKLTLPPTCRSTLKNNGLRLLFLGKRDLSWNCFEIIAYEFPSIWWVSCSFSRVSKKKWSISFYSFSGGSMILINLYIIYNK